MNCCRPLILLAAVACCPNLALAAKSTGRTAEVKPADRPLTDDEKAAGAAGAAAGFGILGMGFLCSAGAIIASFAFYMAPTLIGFLRGHPNMAPIFVVNFFLGWTLVGWVVALAWALTAQERRPRYSSRSSGGENPFG